MVRYFWSMWIWMKNMKWVRSKCYRKSWSWEKGFVSVSENGKVINHRETGGDMLGVKDTFHYTHRLFLLWWVHSLPAKDNIEFFTFFIYLFVSVRLRFWIRPTGRSSRPEKEKKLNSYASLLVILVYFPVL